ncbi:NAD(P)H-hydrate dehydratase [Reichenbachiella agariperforans]|uniref:NAD(P)H-hydrate dehydratase n=1 Tax=Reichenbachiella agariperforans TaxID=156994 RepID=UPI001C084A15|nr:NAD(P)H-hydrate dehydratase [Reichenbachiella agariperforans]MBU2914563.1 NAD(P)H-hydrate dehydratase [Reichenbachiella agariperforans]
MNSNLCLKIFSAEQTRQADQYTITHEPIASIDLMERASTCFVQAFLRDYSKDQSVKVFCGTGNNGGDGLAIARLLLDADYHVEVYLLGDVEKGTPDFQTNLKKLKGLLAPVWVSDMVVFPTIENGDLVIDALFGSGVSRPVEGIYAECIEAINRSMAKDVIAVDIASGLGCETRYGKGAVMEVSHTVTFQSPKLTQLLPENDVHTGRLDVIDIGLSEEFIRSVAVQQYFLTEAFIKSLLIPRKKYAHKGDAGRSLIVAGSFGKMGAAVLAAQACLRSGVGLLTMQVPECGVDILQSTTPEAMVRADKNSKVNEKFDDLEGFDAIGVGPGIGTEDETAKRLKLLIGSSKVPMVLDADALNILSQHPTWLEYLPKGSVLTPHPGEFARLVGEWDDDAHKLALQMELAQRLDAIVLLKGAHSTVATPDGRLFFNSTGNPGMATGGSGDVLTGMVTAFLAQGYDSLSATLVACFVHGRAGDLFLAEGAEESLIASDLITKTPLVLKCLKSR